MSLQTTLLSYVINLSLSVEGVGRLVVFDSYPEQNIRFAEIEGREVFLFDLLDRPVWQIAPERGTTNGRTHPFDPLVSTTEPFVNVWMANGQYYASRMNGDTFLIDMAIGSATYCGWART